MTRKAPGTSSLMPVKGSGCGIRPDLDEFSEDTGFDFSKAHEFLPQHDQNSVNKPETNKDTKKDGK